MKHKPAGDMAVRARLHAEHPELFHDSEGNLSPYIPSSPEDRRTSEEVSVRQRRRIAEGPKPEIRTEEDLFDHILKRIGYNRAASVDLGNPEKEARFYAYWDKKIADGEVPS